MTVSPTIRDPARLAILRRLALLDSPPEPAFDRIARLAARLLTAPIALVTLVDEERQFFKSCIGLPEPWRSLRQTPLSHSICQHVVASGEPLVIGDTYGHPLVGCSPAVVDLGLRAYLGLPLPLTEGQILGSFCVADSRPRQWTDEDIEAMQVLAAAVTAAMELRAANDRLEQIDRVRRRILSVVSHDIATPLTVIEGFSELICNEPLSLAEIKEYAADILREALRLGSMIDQVREQELMSPGRATAEGMKG